MLSYSLNSVRKRLKWFLQKFFVKITQFRVCPSSVSIYYALLLGARCSCGQSYTEYSASKSVKLTPDIVEYEVGAQAPLYDLINR